VAVKIAATVVLIMPLAVLMGTPFAIALRLVARAGPQLFEWTWALNAAATVTGAVLAILLAVVAGITAVFVVAAALYGLGALLLPRMTRTQSISETTGLYGVTSDMAIHGGE
jgi:hypothetical protein